MHSLKSHTYTQPLISGKRNYVLLVLTAKDNSLKSQTLYYTHVFAQERSHLCAGNVEKSFLIGIC